MSTTPDQSLIKKSNPDAWKDKYRFLVLTVVSLVEAGVYTTPYAPIPLEKELSRDLNINATQYSLLFALGDLMGIFLAGLSGFMLTKYGRRIVTLSVLGGFVLGEFCAAIGATILNYYVLLAGQILIGCSLNCWLAVSSTYLSIWFKNRETSFAISFDTCCCYLAVGIMNFVHPRVYNKFHSLTGNYWMMFIITVFSFCCGIILCYLDTFAPKQVEEELKEGEEKFGISAIKKLPALIWLLTSAQLTVLQCFQLQDIMASKMFQELFGLDNETAGIVIASPAFLMGVLSFFSGIVVYRIGRKPLILLLASILALLSIFVLNILPTSDESYAGIGPYLLIALAHAFFSAAFWSAIPYAVEEKLVGFTLGVMITLQNGNSALTTVLVGVIRDNTKGFRKGYLFAGVFIMVLGFTGIVFLFFLIKQDKKTGGKLTIPEMVLAKESKKEQEDTDIVNDSKASLAEPINST